VRPVGNRRHILALVAASARPHRTPAGGGDATPRWRAIAGSVIAGSVRRRWRVTHPASAQADVVKATPIGIVGNTAEPVASRHEHHGPDLAHRARLRHGAGAPPLLSLTTPTPSRPSHHRSPTLAPPGEHRTRPTERGCP